jgi:predicted metal-dependent HD superfamily phosphohydrolase
MSARITRRLRSAAAAGRLWRAGQSPLPRSLVVTDICDAANGGTGKQFVTPSRRRCATLDELCDAARLPPAVVHQIRRRMRAPGRQYHGLGHLEDLWRLHRRFPHQRRLRIPRAERLVARAILFHDAVYDPARSDNEQRSAALWCRVARRARIPRGEIGRVAAAIAATAHHVSGAAREIKGDSALYWFLDLDLGSIGAPPHRFRMNMSRLRAEFHDLAGAEWDGRRLAFLRSLAARSRIYRSQPLAAALEASARANIARELRRG